MSLRAVLVDSNGLVIGYFMASPENDHLRHPSKDGTALVPHDKAFPGDTLRDGVWTQTPENAAKFLNTPKEEQTFAQAAGPK